MAVEVVNGEHDRNWYITTNCTGSDHYWCVVENMQAELQRRFAINNPDSRWLCVGEISAEETNQSGGGAGPGWVILSGHDDIVAGFRHWLPSSIQAEVLETVALDMHDDRHRLLEEGGGTWIEDRITSGLPLGKVGGTLHALLVGRQLRAAWTYRRERLIELLAPVSARAG